MNKFDPTRSMYLRGFDRRGCTASLSSATANSFSVKGNWADLADFVVVMLYDADDNFGHLTTSRYLPDFDLSSSVLEFDLAITNGQYPGSSKYQSVAWGVLSWIKEDGTSGTTTLPISSITGGTKASATWTVNGTPTTYDRIYLSYLGNTVFDDYSITTGDTTAQVAAVMAGYINAAAVPFTASAVGSSVVVTHDEIGRDGNLIAMLEMHKTVTTYLTPAGNTYLTGGTDPTSIHIAIDFDALGLTNLRQAWLTLAPPIPVSTDFVGMEFEYAFSNITRTGTTQLKVAGPLSALVDSRSSWNTYSGTWTDATGYYIGGRAKTSSIANNTVTVKYSHQSSHNLYLGTVLYSGAGTFSVKVDGTSYDDIVENLNTGTNIFNRRAICTSGVPVSFAAGSHTVEFKVKSGTCVYDYLHVVVPTEPASPTIAYSTISAAADFDTDQTYKISPARALFVYSQLGLLGNLDFYAGVFFAHKRVRYGGNFHIATVTLSGAYGTGSGFGDGDAAFFTIGTTTLGAAAFPADTLNTLAQRLVNAINSTFVGVFATKTATLGEFTVKTFSPINGFYFAVTASGTGVIAFTGDIAVGNEGTWQIDSSAAAPLNKGFIAYIEDFVSVADTLNIPVTLAFSQELLGPPDANTSAGAWIQRYADGTTVLTATGFGTWGKGKIEALSAGSYTQTGHGYITGNIVHIAPPPEAHSSDYGVWSITVIDSDHYQLTTLIAGGYTPAVGDDTYIELQTSQCAFNPSTVTPYMEKVYKQAAASLAALGVTPRVQFGEILHWFFAGGSPVSMAFYDANQTAAAVTALGRALASFTGPNDDPSVNSYEDADFLRSRIKDHIHTIVAAVLSATPTTKFELLFPYDVCWPTTYINSIYPYNIGGQLNSYINLPSEYYSDTSDIDYLKMEALAWGTSYRDENNVKDTLVFPFKSPAAWPPAKVNYLIPWQNGGCPWQMEFMFAKSSRIAALCFWAIDHAVLFTWSIPHNFCRIGEQ